MKKYLTTAYKWLLLKWHIPRFVTLLGTIFALIGLVFTAVFFAMQFGLFNVKGSSIGRNASLGVLPNSTVTDTCALVGGTIPKTCNWDQTQEWSVLEKGFTKDSAVINQVSNQTGVPSRMIVATVEPEQMRFFTANRESFKKYFEPLNILSTLTKFSYGVSGVKIQTAKDIEQYANDPTSPFYPGPDIAPLLAYQPGDNHDAVLYDRLTSNNHYYSYIYTAAFIKEIEAQWSKSGYDITQRPDVVVTLFNIGFAESHPNPEPQVSGSTITLGGRPYSFGQLGVLFYESDNLLDVFPRP